MKNERFSVLVVLVAVVIATGIVGSTASAGLINSDDTWVREDKPDDNRNGNDQVNARTDSDGDDNDVILLRFDLTGQTVMASGNSLNLYWYRNDSGTSNTLSLYGLKETHPDETTWAEDTVTYNTAPGLLPDGVFPMNGDPTPQDLDLANLTLLVADQPYGPQVTDQVYTFSGAALDAFLNADTTEEVTFLILRGVSTSGNQARFQVREVGMGAELVIPEPTTAVFCMLGLLGLVRRRS